MAMVSLGSSCEEILIPFKVFLSQFILSPNASRKHCNIFMRFKTFLSLFRRVTPVNRSLPATSIMGAISPSMAIIKR